MSARDAFFSALAFLALVACNMAGGLLAAALHLPVPGTVIGILILLGVLLWLGRVPAALQNTAVFLLGHLNLFYIPAGVGVMVYAALVLRDVWPIAVVLVGSTILALVAGAFAFHWTARLIEKPDEGP
jgi:putative effector of murein hydrolase LrgA (UPF0299 family)